MQVTVDKNVCVGHAQCVRAAPEVFRMGEDGFAVVLVQTVADSSRAGVTEAVDYCPSGAISASEA